jgi:DNA-binding beta-propeller fold protein YncE
VKALARSGDEEGSRVRKTVQTDSGLTKRLRHTLPAASGNARLKRLFLTTRRHPAASKVQQLKFMQFGVRLRCTWGPVAFALLVFLTFSALGCGGSAANPIATPEILYVGNQQPNTVSAYRVHGNGSLAAVPASPFALGGTTLIADPKQNVLFSFGLNSDSLELNTDSIARDGSLKMSSKITDNTLAGVRAINPAGTALYVSSINAAEGNWGWKVYSIRSDGTLQLIDGLIDQIAGRLVFTPDGSTAFSAYCYFMIPNIEQFAVASNGSLTNTRNQTSTPVPFGECPNAVAITPAGDMLAAPWSDLIDPSQGNFITLFNIDPGTHDLNPTDGFMFPASGAGQDAIFDPSGEFLITAQDNGLGVYRVGHESLREVSGSPFGGAAMDRVMLAPLSRLVVAISHDAGQIFVFTLDRPTGGLTLAPGSPVSTSSPYDLAVIRQ